MNGLFSLIADIARWFASAGLFGLFLTLALREFSAWRGRLRERKTLLYLIDKEINENKSTLESIYETPATATRIPADTLQSKVWEDTRIRLAQLVQNESEFRDIASYYQNLRIVRNLMNNPAMSNADKERVIHSSAESTMAIGDDVKEIISKYVEVPNPSYDVFVVLKDKQQPDENSSSR